MQAKGEGMIDINQLKIGDTVRHVESGNAYRVTATSESGHVFAMREIEISNPGEWALVESSGGRLGAIESFVYQVDKDRLCFEAIRQALKEMRSAKPEERNEKARRYAVSITEMEKALAYFHMYVVNDGAGE